MLRYLLVAFLLFPNILCAAQQTILSGTGVYWATEKDKINANFTELYAIDVRNYGAVESSTISSAEAVQAAVDAAEAAGGGVVDIPIAIALDDTITINSNNVSIRGRGQSAPITVLGDYGDVIEFTGNDSTGVYTKRVGASDLYLTTAVARSSGSYISMDGVMFARLDNIWLENGFKGVTLTGAAQVIIDGLYHTNSAVSGQTATGRRLLHVAKSTGAYSSPSGGGIFINNFNLRGLSATDLVEDIVEINAIDGIWFSNGHFGNGTDANILINANTAASTLGFVFFSNVMCDQSLGDGLVFRGNTVVGARMSFGNMTFAGGSTGDNAIHVESDATFSDIQFTNPIASGYAERALFIESTYFRKSTFTGVNFSGNSYTSVGGFPHIELADGTGWITITGGVVGYQNATYLNSAGNSSYAIELGDSLTNVLLSNLDLRKNQSGSILGTGSLTCKFNNLLVDDLPTVASASTIALPRGLAFFTVTGTTDITSISPHDPGKVVYLRAESGLTLVNGSNLILTEDIDIPATETVQLVCDGTSWRRVSTPWDMMEYPDAGIPVSLGEAGWDDSLSFTELVQSLPGSDLATQLDGEDLGVASLSIDPASAPGISGEDAESGDENQAIWNLYGDATTTTAGAVVSDLFFQNKDGGDASGVLTTFAWMDGSENIFKFNVPISVTGLSVYSDNAAAITGGLAAGDFYRTSTGVLMVVYTP